MPKRAKNSYEALVRSPEIAVPALTDLTVKNLPPGLHFDARLTSFGIRVGKTKKTWVVIKGKNRTKVSLGHYPALSLHDARRRALIALASPDAPVERIAPQLFPDVLETYLEHQADDAAAPLALPDQANPPPPFQMAKGIGSSDP